MAKVKFKKAIKECPFCHSDRITKVEAAEFSDLYYCERCEHRFRYDDDKTDLTIKEADERPPKAWWDACTSRAGSFADDPDKFCGALWHNPGQFKDGEKMRTAFGKEAGIDI